MTNARCHRRGALFHRSLRAVGLTAVALTLAGCGGGGDGPSHPDPLGCTVSSVTIAPATVSIAVGATQQLATAASTQNCAATPATTWASNAPNVAAVSATGLVTGISAGSAVLTATIGASSAVATITVTSPSTARVVITPDTVRLTVADSLNTRATATLSDGRPATDPITWSSSNSAVASVDAAGLVIAVSPGTAVLTARAGPASGTARIEVATGHVASIGRVSGPTTFTVTSTEEQVASGTFSLTRTNPTITFARGDVLVGQEAGGYLRKIETVSTSGNVVTVTTSEAELPEAFEAGSIQFEEDLDFASGSVPVAGVRFGDAAPSIAGMGVGRDGIVHFNNAQIPFDFELSGGIVNAPAQIVIKLNGDLEFLSGRGQTGAPTFSLKDKWGRSKSFPWGPELKSFEMSLTAGARLNATVTGELTGAIPSKATRVPRSERTLVSRVLTKGPKGVTCSFFGPVLVCYKITASLVAFVQPSGGPKATLTQKLDVSAGATAGIKWSGGRLTPVFTPFSSSSVPAPVIGLDAEVGVKFGIEPRLAISFYGAGGPEAGIPLGLELEAGLENPYWWYVQPKLFADMAVGLQAKVFGFSLRGQWETNLVTKDLTKVSGPAAKLDVTPTTLSLTQGQTRNLSSAVTSLFSGAVMNPGLSWVSSSPAVATVTSFGLVTAVGGGTATITATIPGTTITSRATVTVQGITIPVASVTLSVPSTTVAAGSTIQATAMPRDASGNALTGRQVTFSSGNTSVATINASGVITGVAPGSAVISAFSEGRVGSITITVTASMSGLSVTSASPANGATNQSIDSKITVTFSSPLDPSSVHGGTFRVVMNGNAVPGSHVLNGNTITYTPTSPLEESQTVTITVTTGVRSTTGASLASNYTGTFSLVFADPAYFYRFYNNLYGQARAFDTDGGTFEGMMANTGNFSGQFWYLTPVPGYDGYYWMRNHFKGDAWYMEGADGVKRVLLRNTTPFLTGQLWKFVGNPFGAGCNHIQNYGYGATKSMANVNGNVIMQNTAATGAQCFSMSREMRRP
jgi:trimeric autotransporter adhesin